MADPTVAFVQDHLVQRGGAERGLLSMLKAAPDARVLAAFYRPEACYPAFEELDIETLFLDKIPVLRRHHRLTLPILAPAISRWNVDADVVICGTSGWAQGVRTSGRKVLYFYALTRWLYEVEPYLKGKGVTTRTATRALRPALERWDRRTVGSADRYITEGTVMRDRLRDIYGLDAEIIPLPHTLDISAPQREVPGVEPGFFLCAARLMSYKNVDATIEAFRLRPGDRLVVAGDGPEEQRLRAIAPANVTMMGVAQDDELRWLYQNCAAVISAAYEPFGLTPVEGAAFGRPSVVLRDGGFVDTVVDGETGLFFDLPQPALIAEALRRFHLEAYDEDRVRAHARLYDEQTFVDRIRAVIDEEGCA